jgi:hypothetical protein
MTTFDQREQAFEAKLAHDEELKFKATVRRNKWLGLWAAAKLGKSGADADAYASALVSAEVDGKTDDLIATRIHADFQKAGIAQSEHQIRRQMDELFAKATQEVMTVARDTKSAV